MKAYLIDPKEQTITQVEHDASDYKNISRTIECDYFTTVILNEHDDTIYLDDEGLLHMGIKYQTRLIPYLPIMWKRQVALKECATVYMFQIDNNENFCYAGKSLVLGTDEEGESCEPTITLDELKKRVTRYFTIG